MYQLNQFILLQCIYKCDQDIIAKLNVAGVVLKGYKKDKSSISMLTVIMGI